MHNKSPVTEQTVYCHAVFCHELEQIKNAKNTTELPKTQQMFSLCCFQNLEFKNIFVNVEKTSAKFWEDLFYFQNFMQIFVVTENQ